MNGMQQRPAVNSWHALFPVNDRRKVVLVLVGTLRDIQGANYDVQKAASMAQEFEKFTFMKTQSREEYLRIIKQKVAQLRSGMRVNMVGGNNQMMNSGQSHTMMPNSMQNMNKGMMGPNMNQGMGQGMMQSTGANMMPNMGGNMASGINAGIGQVDPGMKQNMNQGMGQGMGQGVSQGINQGMTQGMNKGMTQNMPTSSGQTVGNNAQNMMRQQPMSRQHSGPQMDAHMRLDNVPNQTGYPARTMQNQQLPPSQQRPPSMSPNQQQLQQISNMIKNVRIPQALLAKIPNLPPHVNTWSEVFECFQKKIIPASAMPIVKDMHNTHLQLAIRQHEHYKLNQMQGQRLQQQQQLQQNGLPQQGGVGNMNPGTMENPVANTPVVANAAGNMNKNNMTAQQRQQLIRQMQISGQNFQQYMQQMPSQNLELGQPMSTPIPGSQPQQQMQESHNFQQAPPKQAESQFQQGINQPAYLANQQAKVPMMQMLQQSLPLQGQAQVTPNTAPDATITQQDLVKYTPEALRLLSRMQANGSIQKTIDKIQKENFIKKYIYHRKAALWRQAKESRNNLGGMDHVNTVNQAEVQRRLQSQFNASSLPTQVPGASNAVQSQMQPQPHTLPMLGNNQMNVQQPIMRSQTQPSNMGGQGSSHMATPNAFPGNKQNTANFMGSFASSMPPLREDLKIQLKELSKEVFRNSAPLKDVTAVLSPQDKNTVKEYVARIIHQFANLDSIISCFFIIARNIEGTKRLIQMKLMTKSILENIQRGIYLASADFAEKLYAQFQKYFEYIKAQFIARRKVMQQQQQQQQQTQQPQRSQQQQIPFANENNGNAPIQGQASVPPQPQFALQQPMSQSLANLDNMSSWPTNSQLGQQRTAMGRSPMVPSSSPPMMNSIMQGVPYNAQSAGNPMTQKLPPRAQSAKRVSTSNSPPSSQENKKRSISKNGATPANSAATPAALANAIKTPNSVPTPNMPQTQSSKNTPVQTSPGQQASRYSVTVAQNIPHEEDEVFKQANEDMGSAKRKELSTANPEAFFVSSLTNLLGLGDSPTYLTDSNTQTETASETHTASTTNGKNGFMTSPLSPISTSGSWTASIKPDAVTSSFKQIDRIKELLGSDVILSSAQTGSKKKEDPLILVKKDFSEVEENIDNIDNIDDLFSEEKLLDLKEVHKFMYEPCDVEDWKRFMISSTQ